MVSVGEFEICADVVGDEDEDEDEDDDDDDDGRLEALFEAAAAAARAACVTGMCMPKLGRDSDLRRVLYGIVVAYFAQ